jgi:hypothetical protein
MIHKGFGSIINGHGFYSLSEAGQGPAFDAVKERKKGAVEKNVRKNG